MVLIFASDNFVHVILSLGKKIKKMITLFEKIYFGEPCEPYTTYFLKFRPCYFNNGGQRS